MCIVPNIRILDQGKQIWGDKYRSYLLQIIKELLRHDIRVHVIVHDTSGDDLKLAKYICDKASSPLVTLTQNENPFKLKQLIAGSFIVVGSRYHSLVAAFSKHVPSLAIGWSHKYDMLFRDFGFEKFIISPDTPHDKVVQYIQELIDADNNALYRQQIAQHLQEMYHFNQTMWSLLINALTDYSNQ